MQVIFKALKSFKMATVIGLLLNVFSISLSHSDTYIRQIGKALQNPWGMDFLDESNLIVTERSGRMLQINLTTGTHSKIMGLPKIFSKT